MHWSVAQLVLQAVELDGVALSIRRDAWDEEAGQPARRLREREKAVRHRGGAEPFVAAKAVGPSGRLPSGSARVALARTSLPPCFSVIAMPSVTPVFPAIGRKAGS